MGLVFPIVELLARMADFVAAGIAVRFEDIACFEKDLRVDWLDIK